MGREQALSTRSRDVPEIDLVEYRPVAVVAGIEGAKRLLVGTPCRP